MLKLPEILHQKFEIAFTIVLINWCLVAKCGCFLIVILRLLKSQFILYLTNLYCNQIEHLRKKPSFLGAITLSGKDDYDFVKLSVKF